MHSHNSRRTVALLSGQSQDFKDIFLFISVGEILPNLVRCALEAHASPDSRSACPLARPVTVAAARHGHLRILKQLLEAGADLSATDGQGFTALVTAAEQGHTECIKLLLAAGADANKAGPFGNTPLMTAILRLHTDCVKALLPVSDLRCTTRDGLAAFHACALHGNDECFELLLPHVGDVDERTRPGVLSSGDLVSSRGETALRFACQQGKHQMAKALLKRGADRLARDSRQWTPLTWAAQFGHLSCVVLLVGQPSRFKMNPAEVDATDEQGGTALHHAAEGGHTKICGVLIEAGARLDTRNAYGRTPLMIAQHFHPANTALLALLSGAGPAQPPGTVCDHCGKTAAQASVNNLKACSQCHAVCYCGVECSVAAWPGHKAACKARAAEWEEKTKPKIINKPSATPQ